MAWIPLVVFEVVPIELTKLLDPATKQQDQEHDTKVVGGLVSRGRKHGFVFKNAFHPL